MLGSAQPRRHWEIHSVAWRLLHTRGMDDDFSSFVAQARPSLVHLARLLGRDDDAEDVVQTALARLMRFVDAHGGRRLPGGRAEGASLPRRPAHPLRGPGRLASHSFHHRHPP